MKYVNFLLKLFFQLEKKWVFVCEDRSSFLETKDKNTIASEISFFMLMVFSAN